jgi:hypothetical protein
MRARLAFAIMLDMNSPIAPARVVLIADHRSSSTVTGRAALRRFRLARLGFDAPSPSRAAFANHDKRTNA